MGSEGAPGSPQSGPKAPQGSPKGAPEPPKGSPRSSSGSPCSPQGPPKGNLKLKLSFKLPLGGLGRGKGSPKSSWGIPWVPSGGSRAPLGSRPSSSLCLGRPRCLREVFGGHLWSRTFPRMVAQEALRQPKCSHLYNKTNDFRRAPVCRSWCPGVPLGPRKALPGPLNVPPRPPQRQLKTQFEF